MARPTPTSNEIEIKSVDIVVSKADEEGNIEYANPIFYKLSGYNKRELCTPFNFKTSRHA